MTRQAMRFIGVAILILGLSACGDNDVGTPAAVTAAASREWSTYGQSQLRPFFNAQESRITRANVATLRTKWHYLTNAVVTAAATVATLSVPGEGKTKVVLMPSWDGNLYALRAANGSQLWHFTMKSHPGASFPQAASAEVVTVAGEERVYVAGGMTVYALAASTGALRWQFDAGTGCTTCDVDTERNEILSSPTVVDGRVYFGMDVNDATGGKGGLYSVDAVNGQLVWFFDLESGKTCRPRAGDSITRFDGYHTAAELGLPADFFSTRAGCDAPRIGSGCGNVWSSFSVDAKRRLLFIASSNCDTDDDPTTPEPSPKMPPYDEAIFAISYDGDPAWVWRPREIDNDDLAFGGVPNLFTTVIGGSSREVVGVGCKDGTYYLLDRDGTNELTNRVEPYWSTKVVPGGEIGGVIASASVANDTIFFSTAAGLDVDNPQKPAAWSLRGSDGSVRWSNRNAPPSFGPTTSIPGVTFMGGIGFSLFAYDADSGDRLQSFYLGGPVSSAATIVDGEVFIGAGTGARGGSPAEQAFMSSTTPSYITAFCLPDAADCPAALCDDGDPCTYDFHASGSCRSEPAADGLPCSIGAAAGMCMSGGCVARIGAG